MFQAILTTGIFLRLAMIQLICDDDSRQLQSPFQFSLCKLKPVKKLHISRLLYQFVFWHHLSQSASRSRGPEVTHPVWTRRPGTLDMLQECSSLGAVLFWRSTITTPRAFRPFNHGANPSPI